MHAPYTFDFISDLILFVNATCSFFSNISTSYISKTIDLYNLTSDLFANNIKSFSHLIFVPGNIFVDIDIFSMVRYDYVKIISKHDYCLFLAVLQEVFCMDNIGDNTSNKTLAARIADQLRDDIISQKLAPGSRITVKEIADRYAVSSMPVREAFNTLCGEQLLEMNPYRGATVKAVTNKLMAHLNDIASALEPLLIELCMEKGYPEEVLRQLEEINRELAELKDNEIDMAETRIALNVKFHETAYSPCKDHMAYELFQRNLHQLRSIRKYHTVEYTRAKETVQEHAMIIQALRNKDVVSAVTISKIHTQNSKRYTQMSEKYEEG